MPFTPKEIEDEQAGRRADSGQGGPQLLECVHCKREFDPAEGGNAEVPLCDHCLHRD